MHPFPPLDRPIEPDHASGPTTASASRRGQAGYERVPSDLPRGFAAGASPHRILVSATDAFCGRGVSSHSSGLIGRLAHEFGVTTGHGADVEVARPSGSSPVDAIDGVRAAVHDSTDVVMVELDHELLTARQLVEIGARLRALTVDFSGRAQVVLLVQGPVPAEAAGRIDRVLARFGEPVHLHLLPPRTGTARKVYADWARGLAAEVSPKLRFPRHWIAAADLLDETARRRAIDRLSVLEARWSTLLQALVDRARTQYRTESAAIALIDERFTRFAPTSGPTSTAIPRHQSLCDTTIRVHGGLVVGDARADTRFASLPAVLAGDIRYYAGHRIRDPNGEPVGTICVTDPDPRRVDQATLTVLRGLAAEAERAIPADRG